MTCHDGYICCVFLWDPTLQLMLHKDCDRKNTLSGLKTAVKPE